MDRYADAHSLAVTRLYEGKGLGSVWNPERQREIERLPRTNRKK
jgi:hypothetical protein